MTTGLRQWLLAVTACVLAAAVCADEVLDEAAERARIASERSAARATFAERERDCADRFAVTACVEAARRDQNAALIRLRRQESLLDAAQRRQKAAQRMQTIRDKVSADEARQRENSGDGPRPIERDSKLRVATPRAEGPSASAADPSVEAPVPAASAASAGEPKAKRPLPKAAPVARSASDVAARRKAFAERQKAAQAHRDAVEWRNVERASSGKPPATPLPVAPPASTP